MSGTPPATNDKLVASEAIQPESATAVEETAATTTKSTAPKAMTSQKRGHAPKPSVGIAASLFGSAGDDDPFSSIAASNATSSLSQLTEADEEPDLFGSSHARNNHTSDKSADPVTSLFGAEPETTKATDTTSPTEPSAAAAAPATEALQVPAPDCKANGPSSGPASPGGLFADSSYQDDWLGSSTDQSQHQSGAVPQADATANSAADPFGAPDGGEGSLSWLNGAADAQATPTAEPQYDAYGRPIGNLDSDIVGYDQENYDQQQQGYDYDQQQGYAYDQHQNYDYQQQQGYDGQQGYDYQQQQGYDQQNYDQQNYDQQNYDQHGYEPQGYDQNSFAQQDQTQQDYYQQQGYEQADHAQQSYNQSGYDQQSYAYGTPDPYAPVAPVSGVEGAAAHSYDANAYSADPTYQGGAQYGANGQHSNTTEATADYTGYTQNQAYGYDASQGQNAYETSTGNVTGSQNTYGSTAYSQDAASYGAYDAHSYAPDANAGQQHADSNPYAPQQNTILDPYAASQQPAADQQVWSHQTYGYDAQPAESLQSGHNAGAYDNTYAASNETNGQSYGRSPSPYDPPPVVAPPRSSSAAPVADANTYAAPSSTGPPPPPKGPPMGPPKGPPRGPSRSASRNAQNPSISSTSTFGSSKRSAAISLEQESHEQPQSTWSNGPQTPQKDQPTGATDTPPTTYKHPSSAWVDSLEQAAATPPPSHPGDDSLPTLTVTDDSGNGYDHHPSQGTEEIEDRGYGEHKSDRAVDEAASAFNQLDLGQSQDPPTGQDYEYNYGYSQGDGSAPRAHASEAGHQGQDYSEHGAAQQSGGWNGYGNLDEEGGAATNDDPYAPHDPQQQQHFEKSSETAQSYDPYSAESHGNEVSSYNPYTPSVDANGAADDAEARTPLASHREDGDWLQAGSSAYEASAGQSPYSPATAADSPYAPPTAASAASSYGGYEPYGPQTGHDRAADPYAAEDHYASRSNADAAYGGESQPREMHQQGDYFDPNRRSGSPQQGYGNNQGVPTSPYEPHDQYASSNAGAGQYPPSATSETRSQAASEASIDMLQTMRNATIPIASFGIGGKLVSYFPTSRGAPSSMDGNAYSYNASSYPTTVNIQALSSLVPSSAFATAFDPLTFLGPIFEGAAGTNALSRATGAASANKTKKAALIKHLDERVKELSAGIGYLRRRPSVSGSATGSGRGALEQDGELEARRTEDKVLLLRLLKLLVENDGQTSSTAFEQGVRSLIVPSESQDAVAASPFAMSVSSTTQSDSAQGEVVTTHELRTGFLQKIQGMLLRGERRQAVEYAVAQRMWAHAMTIASCVDKDCWKQVVSEFIEQEVDAAETSLGAQGQGDLQGLKVAYNVFSGQDPVSIFDLFRTKTQLASMGGLQASSAESASVSNALPSWKESAAIVASNKSASDSAALTAIGDGLCTRGLLEAAHFCYLLSPTTSPMGGADSTGARFTLLGMSSPKTSAAFVQDLDAVLMTEVLEFAQGLVPAVKGQEPFPGIPHLQAYKLVHAQQLADLGEVAKAQRYCEAIAQCLKQSKPSPYLHSTLLAQSKQLSDRLVGAPQAGPGGNWVTRKMQRPTLDGVWGALEGRFTKFIAGEDGAAEGDSPNKTSKGSASSSIGPFSHYSAITPDAASGGLTRQQSYVELNSGSPSVPTSRSGSAMDFRNATKRAASPKHRAASALSMRPLISDSHGDWPQQRGHSYANDSASNYERESVRSSLEAPRNTYGYGANQSYGGGHGNQASEFSTSSSTYGAGEASFTSDNVPWQGNAGLARHDAESTGRPSTDATRPAGGSESGYGGYGDYGSYGGYNSYGGYGAEGSQAEEAGSEDRGDSSGYSGPGQTPFYGYELHGAQKPQFISNVEAADALEGAGEGGFVSPFDALSSQSRTPQPQSQGNQYAPSYGRNDAEEEEEVDDDLGLGNSSTRKKSGTAGASPDADTDEGDVSRRDSVASSGSKQTAGDTSKDDPGSNAGEEKKQELKPSASWFGRLWGRSSSTDQTSQAAQAKAKKAHLGEETSFVYDKELKRWVNKKAGDSSSAASTPPPPPPPARTQSASPASQPDRSGGASSAPPMRGPPSGSFTMGRATPPISEGQDEGSSGLAPARGPPSMGSLNRARSNLADHSMPPAAQPPMSSRSGASTPGGVGSPPAPPPGGSRTGTVRKRPIKSRYVVVD